MLSKFSEQYAHSFYFLKKVMVFLAQKRSTFWLMVQLMRAELQAMWSTTQMTATLIPEVFIMINVNAINKYQKN